MYYFFSEKSWIINDISMNLEEQKADEILFTRRDSQSSK